MNNENRIVTLDNLAKYNTYKQDKLVSGTTIKTVNGESVLGSGDIKVEFTKADRATDEEIMDLFGGDDSPLEATVAYSNQKEDGGWNFINRAEIRINANKELNSIDGWDLTTDRMALYKEVTSEESGSVTISDKSGNELIVSYSIVGVNSITPTLKNLTATLGSEGIKVEFSTKILKYEPNGWTKSNNQMKRFYKIVPLNEWEIVELEDIWGNEASYSVRAIEDEENQLICEQREETDEEHIHNWSEEITDEYISNGKEPGAGIYGTHTHNKVKTCTICGETEVVSNSIEEHVYNIDANDGINIHKCVCGEGSGSSTIISPPVPMPDPFA